MNTLLFRITRLAPTAVGLAVGIALVGVLAFVGGSYAKQVVHDQLAPQKITFPKTQADGLFPDLQQYAGQRVDDGAKAKAYADKFINRHLQEVAGGLTYAEVSTKAMAAPNDQKLAGQKTTLFQGETLRGLLLSVWGWSVVGTIATLAGILLFIVGLILAALPIANRIVNGERDPREVAA